MSDRQAKRQANLQRRNDNLREAFRARYTAQPRPHKFTREYVVEQLAEEYFLSADRVEDILYQRVNKNSPGRQGRGCFYSHKCTQSKN